MSARFRSSTRMAAVDQIPDYFREGLFMEGGVHTQHISHKKKHNLHIHQYKVVCRLCHLGTLEVKERPDI